MREGSSFTTQKHAPPSINAEINAEVGQSNLTLRVTPMSTDCNINGHVFGGWLMGQTDLAGAILAFKAATATPTMTTVAVKNLVFVSPVFAGNLISFYAKLIKMGNTSMTIEVTGFAWSHKKMSDEAHLVVEATIVYVGLDEDGKPTAVV